MKSSACCITRSKLAPGFALCGALFVCSTTPLQAQNPVAAGSQATISLAPQDIVDANTLTRDGNRPFHLKLAFQIFDMQGLNPESGSLEYWWAGPQGRYVEITSPSLGTVHELHGSDTDSPAVERSYYLLEELLAQFTRPGVSLGSPRQQVTSETRTVSKIAMSCMHTAYPAGQAAAQAIEVCADVATGTIRTSANIQNQVIRNRVGRFDKTRVALDLVVMWDGKQAITGKVEQLQSFDPSSGQVPLARAQLSLDAKKTEQVKVSGGVLAGHKLGGSAPVYPEMARRERVQGSVVLVAKISKMGQIARLVPLASPDASLTEAAMRAVSTWRYSPYLLDGEPVEVTTTITVNFNMKSQTFLGPL